MTPAATVVDQALDWIGQRGGDQAAPWFAWVHLMDPHDPYVPRHAWRRPEFR